MDELQRLAAIDIGSNTAKITIVERQPDGAFESLLEEAHVCRLGEGFARNRLKKAAIERTIAVLKLFLLYCRRYEVNRIRAVGTSALRDAANAAEFVSQVARLGIEVEILTGQEEARLSFVTVRRDPLWRERGPITVVDIGGGSTEIASGADKPKTKISLPMGGVRLTEKSIKSDPPSPPEVAVAREAATVALANLPRMARDSALVGVGGTCVNIGSVAASAAGKSGRVHGSKVSLTEVESQIQLYSTMPLEQRKRIDGLDPTRADVILAGALILAEAMRALKREQMEVCGRGLRWGLIYERFAK